MGIAGVLRGALLCAIRGATVENTHLEMYKLGLWGLEGGGHRNPDPKQW